MGQRRGVREFHAPRSGPPSEEVFLNKASQDKQALAEAKFKRKEIQARDGVKATTEYEAAGAAIRQKTARLRALRLAKEEADKQAAAEAAPQKAKEPKGGKKKL